MRKFSDIYLKAKYYDIIFRRDVSDEVDFVANVYAKYCGKAPSSVVDIACGPGYHARSFARRGFRAIGLDLSPEMIEFARDEAEAEGVRVEWLVADMRDFMLSKPVDLAIASYDSTDCLVRQEDIIHHFVAVSKNLNPSGIYVIELTHPRDCWMWSYGDFKFSGERDGVKVSLEWGKKRSEPDPIMMTVEAEVVLTVAGHGSTEVMRDVARDRFTSPSEFVALAKLSGALEVIDWFGDFRLDQPFNSSPEARRMIIILRKT